eukprot:1160598-Pelagomonas_calceolata.AAC.3
MAMKIYKIVGKKVGAQRKGAHQASNLAACKGGWETAHSITRLAPLQFPQHRRLELAIMPIQHLKD